MNTIKVKPIFRMFDPEKTNAFYIDWLGFTVDWEHRFGDNFPLYMQISLGELVLHLSEHHGDSTPGSKVFIECTGIEAFHASLIAKEYKYNKPGLNTAPWNAKTMELTDPSGNKLLFSQRLD